MTETECLVVLNAVAGVGNRKIRKLIEYFGSAQKVLSLSRADLLSSGVLSPQLVGNIFDFPQDSFLRSEYNLVAKHQVQVTAFSDPSYPGLLREIPDAPVVLYSQGELIRYSSTAIAFVGSRRASVYGLTIARKFSSRLAELGVVIVSGLARGIDTASHEGCLQSRGVTIAVLGCGLANIYPPENEALAQRIKESGAVISEFPMTMPPLACNFPRRNRIISGMSLATVVVEAAAKSGALITADFALEQGRDVFAIPGQVDNPNSRGVHQLIQQGAKLVSCPEDILTELSLQLRAAVQEEKTVQSASGAVEQNDVNFSADEQSVYSVLDQEPRSLDCVIEQSRVPRSRVVAAMMGLELKRAVQPLPGQYFIRKREPRGSGSLERNEDRS